MHGYSPNVETNTSLDDLRLPAATLVISNRLKHSMKIRHLPELII